ncbi:MAG: DNA cytosine methyltransferase, partial [Phototrophicaceae bacterium]
LGYRVQVKALDAVDFGVPQFRNRVWFWGTRNDVDAVHRWPVRTHMDPAKRGALFGDDLPPWVSCGDALRDITDEPSPPIPADAGNAVSEYRYSEAMYAKHAPAAPAPTVQAKWYKGGAEGLVMAPSADGRPWDSRHPVASPPAPAPAPAPAIRARSPRDGGRCTENVVVVPGPHLPTTTIFGEPVKWIRKGDDWMRRLSPMECARLQSVPDDFVWPESVSKSARYRIIGNGVACGIAVHLSRAIAEADPKSRTVLDLFCGGGLWACGWHGRSWTHKEAR